MIHDPSLCVRTRPWGLPLLIAALLAGAAYAITLKGTYVYDDVAFIRDDARLHDVRQWGRFWTEPYHTGVDILYRPLTSLSFAIQWWLHGERPLAFHLVNVLLHMGVSVLVASLGQKLGGWTVGLLAGALFAVHPVHVEAVAGLVGRAELLCALGVLGALRLWLHRPLRIGRAMGIVALFVLAALSKEQGMLLPLILAAALPWRAWGAASLEPSDPPGAPERERTLVKLTLVVLMFAFAGYIFWREGHPDIRMSWDRDWIIWSGNPIVEASGLNRWMLPTVVAGRYVALLVAPIRLSLDYGGHVVGPIARWSDPYLWIGLFSLIAGAAATILAWRRRRYDLLLLLLGLGLSYGLVSNFAVVIGTIMAERLMYLPSAFFLILVGYALSRIPAPLLSIVIGVLVTLGAWRTTTYAARWNQPLALYRSLMDEHPESARGYRLTARSLFLAGDRDAARAVLDRGLQRVPDDLDFWFYAARMALVDHDPQRALALLDRAQHAEAERQARLGIHRSQAFEEIETWRANVYAFIARQGDGAPHPR